MASLDFSHEQPPRRYKAFEPLTEYRYKKCLVGLEEHVGLPKDMKQPVIKGWSETMKFRQDFIDGVLPRLTDIDLRLQEMDKCGIAAQVLSLGEPACQGYESLEESQEFATSANKYLYETYCQAHPTRFFGLATVPTQDGQAAADELERTVKEYGFKGCLINGYTPTSDPLKPIYLDHPMYEPFWSKVQELDVVVFLHPRTPVIPLFSMYQGYPGLVGAPYGFGREAAEHAMRLMCSGLFDRFPKVRVALGHLGEGLSFILPRLDARARVTQPGATGPHKQQLRYYWDKNFIIATSGHFTTSALQSVLAEHQISTVVYADDYPFESIEEHVDWWRAAPLSEQTWKDVSYRNIIKLLRLPLNFDEEQ